MRYLTRDLIDVRALMDLVSDPHHGGLTFFLGTVRSGPDDGPVESIEYSAYDEMVEAEFERIVTEAHERWSGSRVVARHRLGVIGLGEASIAIVAAAPHRDEAFAACRYVIEEAKRRLPVWKKEHLASGDQRWRENTLVTDGEGWDSQSS